MGNYIFGPVPSRRLGFSLGIDVVPYKICSLDCIYCQLGRTTEKTIDYIDFVSIPELISELKQVLIKKEKIDFITLSGSGEPTLYKDIDKLISEIKKITTIPVALITNGTLLWKKEVRDKIMKANLVIPSLDAGDNETFQKINRPCQKIDFNKYIKGLVDFSHEFAGTLKLEVFIVKGINDTEESIKKIAAIAEKISCDAVELNTLARPPAELWVESVENKKLHFLASFFKNNVVVIDDFSKPETENFKIAEKDEIVALLKRRPCSEKDIANSLQIHRNELVKLLELLTNEDKIITELIDDKLFYKYKRV